MMELTPMQGNMKFGDKETPLMATAVGLGYLKQPLRYLTQDDIKAMGSRANGTRYSQGTGFEHNIPKPNFDKPTYNFGEVFTFLNFVSFRW
jgi:hypothetical protein